MGKMKRVETGHVTSIDAHSDGKHLSVNIRHGRRKPKKKGDAFQYDDRPQSNLVVPKEHAQKYYIGQRLNVSAAPVMSAQDADDDEDGAGDAQDLDALSSMKSKASRGLFNATNRR